MMPRVPIRNIGQPFIRTENNSLENRVSYHSQMQIAENSFIELLLIVGSNSRQLKKIKLIRRVDNQIAYGAGPI